MGQHLPHALPNWQAASRSLTSGTRADIIKKVPRQRPSQCCRFGDFVARSGDFEQHLEILFAALRHVAFLVIFHRDSGEYWRFLGFGILAEVDTARNVLLFHF